MFVSNAKDITKCHDNSNITNLPYKKFKLEIKESA